MYKVSLLFFFFHSADTVTSHTGRMNKSEANIEEMNPLIEEYINLTLTSRVFSIF